MAEERKLNLDEKLQIGSAIGGLTSTGGLAIGLVGLAFPEQDLMGYMACTSFGIGMVGAVAALGIDLYKGYRDLRD